MRRLRIQNPTVENTFKTYLDAEYTSGVTLTVKSNVSLSANDLLVVGEPSEEFSELKKMDSKTGISTITLASALNFSHNKETPVYKVLWDFISIEGRSSSAGTFAELSSSPIQWDDKNNETIYFHSGGNDQWEYRFRFYNSVTTLYSEYSPTITGAVAARNTVSQMVDNVRKIVNDNERKIVSDLEIIRFFNRAQDIIYARNPRYWFLLVDTYKALNGISTTADTSVYSLASYTTFGHLDSIRYRYNDGTTDNIYHLKFKGNKEFDSLKRDLNATNDDWVITYKLLPADSSSSKGYFEVDPTPKTTSRGTFYPSYYEKMSDLDSVEDTTQVPLPNLLEDYAISRIYAIKGDESRSNEYMNQFTGPADRRRQTDPAWGLVLLDELDDHQKHVQGQPFQLVRFRGQKAVSRLYGESTTSSLDQLREDRF